MQPFMQIETATSVIIPGNAVTAERIALGDVSPQAAIKQCIGLEAVVEAHCKLPKLVDIQAWGTNALVQTLCKAFARHYPVTLSPDIIWNTILQGFAAHMDTNAEKLRHKFVSHDGQEALHVNDNSLVKGNPNNNWSRGVGQFSEQIKDHIGEEMYGVIVRDFSTTSLVDRVACKVSLMKTMDQYFSYGWSTMCGIPTFTLEGSVDDWQKVRDGVDGLSSIDPDLSWWTDPLKSFCDQFTAASAGHANQDFWRSFFNDKGGSGGPYYSGHMLTLFPYLKSQDEAKRNPYMDNPNPTGSWGGLTMGSFSTSLSVVDFEWDYYGTIYNMQLAGGVLGASEVQGTLRPQIGWAVLEKVTVPEKNTY